MDNEMVAIRITNPDQLAIAAGETGISDDHVGAGDGAYQAYDENINDQVKGQNGETCNDNTITNASLVTDASGLVFVETSAGNMLLTVGGDLGSANYTGGLGTTDLQGRQLLTTGFLTPMGVVDSQGGAVYVNQTSVDGETIPTIPLDTTNIILQQPDQLLTTKTGQMTTGVTQEHAQNDHQPESEKKRRGGWPKGKKRKSQPELQPPRPPPTGYVLYAMERRQEIKESNPEIPFAEVTKILGHEWTKMLPEKKQKYLDEAGLAKKKYSEELKAFHRTDAYQNLMKKKKAKLGLHNAEAGWDDDNISMALSELEDDSISDLYCRICDQYFSSVHNKKEHLLGRTHQQNVAEEVSKEFNSSRSDLSPTVVNGDLQSNNNSDVMTNERRSGALDVTGFIHDFIQENHERELEIREIRNTLKNLQEDNNNLFRAVNELKTYQNNLTEEMISEKSVCASLSLQIEGLKNVQNLFKVVNFQV